MKDGLDLSHILMATPDTHIDLSQAASLHDTGGNRVVGDAPIPDAFARFKRDFVDSLAQVMSATDKMTEKQNDVILGFTQRTQEALNDIDGRLNYLSRQQAQTEDVIDALLKVWMLGGTDANLDEQKQLIENFLKRGMPPELVVNTAVEGFNGSAPGEPTCATCGDVPEHVDATHNEYACGPCHEATSETLN